MPATKALERVYYASLLYTLLSNFQLCVLDLVVIGVMQNDASNGIHMERFEVFAVGL